MLTPVVWESVKDGVDTPQTGGEPAANEDTYLLRLHEQGAGAEAHQRAMIESLPDRPLRIAEVEQIEEAGGYESVTPEAVLSGTSSPVGEKSTEQVIIVADEWSGAIVWEDDGWEMLFRDEREDDDEPPDVLYMAAMEKLGL